MKKQAKVEHLANWYFGNFCVKCAKIDEEWDYEKSCWDKIHQIAENLKKSGIEKMTHKEFTDLLKKGTTFCQPVKRKFKECELCKKLGVPQQRW